MLHHLLRFVPASMIAMLSTASFVPGQLFGEIIVGQPSPGFGPTTYRIVLPEPGTFTVHDSATFVGQPVPPTPLPPFYGGMDYDHGMRAFVVTNGPLFWGDYAPHDPSASPQPPPLPWPQNVTSQLGDFPVDISFAGGTRWLLGAQNGRFVEFDFVTFQTTGPAHQVANLGNIVGFCKRGFNVTAVDAAGTRYQINPLNWTVISSTPPSQPLPAPVVDFACVESGPTLALLQNGTVVNLAAVNNPIATGVSGNWLAVFPVIVQRSMCAASLARFRPLGPNIGGNPYGGVRLQNLLPNQVGVLGLSDGWNPAGVSLGGPGCGVHLFGGGALVAFAASPAGVADFAFGLPPVTAPSNPFTIQAGLLIGSTIGVTDAVALQIHPD